MACTMGRQVRPWACGPHPPPCSILGDARHNPTYPRFPPSTHSPDEQPHHLHLLLPVQLGKWVSYPTLCTLTPAESRHLDFCLGPSRLLPNRRPSCVRCMCVTFAHFFLYQVCVCVRTFRCLRISYYELCLLFRVKSRARRRQLGWKLTRGYGCWRGVAAGAAPGTCYSLHPLAPSGGARIDMIQL